MAVTKTQYANAKETLEAVQHLPVEAQRTILNMLHGAIAISDLYTAHTAQEHPAERPSA